MKAVFIKVLLARLLNILAPFTTATTVFAVFLAWNLYADDGALESAEIDFILRVVRAAHVYLWPPLSFFVGLKVVFDWYMDSKSPAGYKIQIAGDLREACNTNPIGLIYWSLWGTGRALVWMLKSTRG